MYSWDLSRGILVHWETRIHCSEYGYELHDEPIQFLFLKPKLKVYGKGVK